MGPFLCSKLFPWNHSFPFDNERTASILCNRSRSRPWTSCVPVCWRSWTILAMKGRQTVSVCFSGKFLFLNSHRCLCFILVFCFFFPALRQNKQYFNPSDTNTLVGAVAFGKGLSKCRPPGPVAQGHPGPGTMMSGSSALQQAAIGNGPVQQAGSVGPQQPGQQGKSQEELFRFGLISPCRRNTPLLCAYLPY